MAGKVGEVAYQASLFAMGKFGQPDLFIEQADKENEEAK